jgi:DNA-binding transcriptional ArsR family regulator
MAYVGDQLAALADPTRLAVFERLAKRPAAVQEIADHFPVSRPAISQHLRVLKDAGLVLDEAVGSRRIYRVNPGGIEEIRSYFDRFWSDALSSFKAFIETDPSTNPKTPHATTDRRTSRRSKDDRRKR